MASSSSNPDITGEFGAEMDATVAAITSPGRGILAADESTGTIGARFQKIQLENVEENRQRYRELLFTTDPSVGNFVSGAILYEETLFQKARDGVSMVEHMKSQNVIPGIKVDKGVVPLPGRPGEVTTQGLDGLAERCQKYYEAGARFAKWRAVYSITDKLPSEECVELNATGLARYAAICQANGLVPIVEPEVLMDGDHTVERAVEVTRDVLSAVFRALVQNRVNLKRILLKPNMTLAGLQGAAGPADAEVAARATLDTLRDVVPPAVRGIVFLSGGQTEEEATLHLDLINKLNKASAHPSPWSLTFSYGRALQASAIRTWNGKDENIKAAQEAYYKRAKMNSLAAQGEYDPSME